MFGLPGETVADAFETIEMMQKIQPDIILAMVFHPNPGLNITKYAIKKGYITEKDLLKLGERKYERYNSILQQPDINTVMNIHKFYMVLTKFKLLSPFIKKLVRLKPNPIFNFIFAISRQFNHWKIARITLENSTSLGITGKRPQGFLDVILFVQRQLFLLILSKIYPKKIPN
jgi:hypothetical protein